MIRDFKHSSIYGLPLWKFIGRIRNKQLKTLSAVLGEAQGGFHRIHTIFIVQLNP
jgi:hypothetical protein